MMLLRRRKKHKGGRTGDVPSPPMLIDSRQSISSRRVRSVKKKLARLLRAPRDKRDGNIQEAPHSSESDSGSRNLPSSRHSRALHTVADESSEDDSSSTSSHNTWSDRSIMTTWSSDSEYFEGSEYHGLDRLLRRFQSRDRTLQKLVKGQRKSYQEMLLAHEQNSRQLRLTEFNERHGVHPEVETIAVEHPVGPTWLGVQRHFLFEAMHSTEGVWMVLCYCFGHIAYYSFLEQVLKSTLTRTNLSPNLFHGVLVTICLLLMRASGYLWVFLHPDSYRLVKFDMHNRVQMGYWDARILGLLKGSIAATAMLNMFSFYGAYIGMSFFYNKMWLGYENYLSEWYDNMEAAAAEATGLDTCEAVQPFVPWGLGTIANEICVDRDWTYTALVLHATCASLAAAGMLVVKADLPDFMA